MNILILGGAGFVGNNLVRYYLTKTGSKITVVDSLDSRLKSNITNLKPILNKIKFIKGDILDKNLMERVVKNQDTIINCAGQTSHPLSLQDPAYDIKINCLGNISVLEAVRKFNPKTRLIYISSSTIIGKANNENIDETHQELPLDIYSANKGVAEKYYYIYHKVYGLNTLSLRFANLYGAYGKGYPEFGFINYFISLAQQNKPIPIFGDGKQIRNVMYVEDLCELIFRCSNEPDLFGKVFFAVHQEHYSIKQITQAIINTFRKGQVIMTPWPTVRKKIEIDNVIISGKRLYDKLKWRPKFNLSDGLKRTKTILEEKD